MSYLYLASPYTHPAPVVMQQRYLDALDALDWLLHNKIWAFSPIVHSHNLPNLNVRHQRDYKYWREFNHLMILNSRGIALLQLDGWKDSEGIADELEYADKLGLKVTIMQKQGPNYTLDSM
jgi:predicted acyl esterase